MVAAGGGHDHNSDFAPFIGFQELTTTTTTSLVPLFSPSAYLCLFHETESSYFLVFAAVHLGDHLFRASYRAFMDFFSSIGCCDHSLHHEAVSHAMYVKHVLVHSIVNVRRDEIGILEGSGSYA